MVVAEGERLSGRTTHDTVLATDTEDSIGIMKKMPTTTTTTHNDTRRDFFEVEGS